MLLALATLSNLHIFTWDVDSAYLHSKIDHDLYIVFPDSYVRPGKVTKLNKVLYGLPEAMQVWHEDLEETLKSLVFTHLGRNSDVFLCKTAAGITAIDTHVDNGMEICLSKEEELNLKASIQKFYKIKE